MVDDLSDLYAELRRLRRDVDRLQTATPLQNASIGSGGLRVYGGGVITIQNGGLSVTGFAQISGELRGNGTINWTGPVNFSGPVQITGTLDVTASTRLRGETTIEATARLLSELIVQGKITAGDVRIENGKVYAGGMTLDPTVAGGALTFPNGSRLEADGANSGERLIAGDAVVNVGAVSSIRKGASAVSVAPNSVTINASGGDVSLIGGVRVSGLPTYGGTGLPLGTLRATNTGQVERADGT